MFNNLKTPNSSNSFNSSKSIKNMTTPLTPLLSPISLDFQAEYRNSHQLE